MLKLLSVGAIALLAIVLGSAAANATTNTTTNAMGSRTGFAFVSPHIAGAPTGAVAMTGIGSFDSSAGTLHASGLFRCTDTVAQGPLSGCASGQGIRWNSSTLVASQGFKCVGGPEALKTATTGADTVAFQGHFFRVGDGQTASFTAAVIVSDHDIAPDIDGVQRTWVQGVGCGNALEFLSH